MTDRLPALRRKRRFNLPGLAGRFLPGVQEIDAQVEPYARLWDDANDEARAGAGPLWVALGDSATQGVGASTWANGWSHSVLNRLRDASGAPWRLVNLSMSGGRFLDVADTQVPVMNTMLPSADLVTCVVGSNDLMWRRSDGVFDDAQALVEVLPPGTLLSRLNGPGPRPKRLNEIFGEAATRRDYRLFNIWNWPSGRDALARDSIHPSDRGYQYMADLAWDAITATRGL